MLRSDSLESVICQELARVGTCTLQELNERLPYFSWSQVFSAVNRLNREGTVTLQRRTSLEYILSLTPVQPAEARHVMPL
jgi:hypothetical protein